MDNNSLKLNHILSEFAKKLPVYSSRYQSSYAQIFTAASK